MTKNGRRTSLIRFEPLSVCFPGFRVRSPAQRGIPRREFALGVSAAALLFAAPVNAASFPPTCGPYAVRVQMRSAANRATTVTFRRADRPAYRLEAPDVLALACVHLTGHAVPDIILRKWTGGGSCCEVVEVIQLDGGPRRALHFQGRILEIRRNPRTDRKDVVGLLDVLHFFGGLCGACSPGLPAVYVYDGTRYVERSSRVPVPVIGYAARERKQLEARGLRDTERTRSGALGILAAYMLLGREAEGWRIVSVAPAATLTWLRQHYRELRAVIGRVRE